jgi:hypothetical protein
LRCTRIRELVSYKHTGFTIASSHEVASDEAHNLAHHRATRAVCVAVKCFCLCRFRVHGRKNSAQSILVRSTFNSGRLAAPQRTAGPCHEQTIRPWSRRHEFEPARPSANMLVSSPQRAGLPPSRRVGNDETLRLHQPSRERGPPPGRSQRAHSSRQIACGEFFNRGSAKSSACRFPKGLNDIEIMTSDYPRRACFRATHGGSNADVHPVAQLD